MTSIPPSRRARATIFAPRSCPSSPGLATTTRILRSAMALSLLVQQRPQPLAGLHDGFAVAGHRLPVEAFPVIGPARDQVQVEMGDGLEGRRAVGLEQIEAVGLQGFLDRPGDGLRRRYRGREILGVRLEDRRGMGLRHYQTVTRIERVDVHER